MLQKQGKKCIKKFKLDLLKTWIIPYNNVIILMLLCIEYKLYSWAYTINYFPSQPLIEFELKTE